MTNIPYRGAPSVALGSPSGADSDSLYARVAALEAGGGGSGDLSAYQLRSEKAQANGYASLDASGKVLAAQLPALTDFSLADVTIGQMRYSEAVLAANNWFGICWSPTRNLFVAVADTGTSQQVITSPDGFTWTGRTISSRTWRCIAWAPNINLFCTAAMSGAISGQIATSPDGITWTNRSSHVSRPWTCVIWVPELTLFIMGASVVGTSQIETSPDGITWTFRSHPDFGFNASSSSGLAYSPTLNLVVGAGSAGVGLLKAIITSSDGFTWTVRDTPVDSLASVRWIPELSKFVAVGNNVVATSTDGVTWITTATPTGNWVNLEWSPELGFMFAGATSLDSLIISSDGVTWTNITVPISDHVRGIAYSPSLGIFVLTNPNYNKFMVSSERPSFTDGKVAGDLFRLS